MEQAKTHPVASVASKAQPQLQKSSSGAIENWAELEAKYKQDIEALTESTEMATIEKEIAEEKLDTCERELQELKDKFAEATLQIDNLRREQSDQSMGAGATESTVTVMQLQKVEEQNELLKQALIKLRDISAKDKQTLEDLQIEREELQVKVLDLEEKEHKYLEQIKVFGEQIDNNQSAQEMVEKLTQQKTELEDKLKEMIDDIDCMEKLRDLNEQLLESARENEIELTGQIDQLRVQCAELSHKRRDLEEYLTDQERTVTKLKDENRIITEQLNRLNDRFKEGQSIEQQKHQIENVAYKLNFSESKMAEKESEIARYKRNLVEMEEQMNNLSLITKEQSASLDELKKEYEAKVSENSELQRALKKKMEEVSELEIRRDMAEKKVQSLQKDKETKVGILTRQIETMKGIEIQHEEDMKRLMEDNEIIERERRELRDQLNRSARSIERTMQTGGNISMVTAQDTSLASLGISFQSGPSNQASPIQTQQVPSLNQCQIAAGNQQILPGPIASAGHARRLFESAPEADDTLFLSRIKHLSAAFDHLARKNYDLELELAVHELDGKVPPYNGSSLSSVYDIDRAKSIQLEVKRVKKEMRATIINQQICTKSRNVISQARNDQFNIAKLAMKCQALENEASALISNSKLAITRQDAPLLHSTPVR